MFKKRGKAVLDPEPWGPEWAGSAPVHCRMAPRSLHTATGSSGALRTPPLPLHGMWASAQGVPKGLSGDLPALSTELGFPGGEGGVHKDIPTPVTPPFADSSTLPVPQFDPLCFLRSGPCHSSFQDWEKHARCYGRLGERVAGEDSILKE